MADTNRTGSMILDRDGCHYFVKFSYDADVVETLKDRIPSSYRMWEASYKRWTIDTPFGPDMWEILNDAGYTIRGDIPDGIEDAALTEPTQILSNLFSSLPASVQHSVYRQLTMAFHPDKGGDLVWMQSLNIAWEQTQKE